MATFSNKYCLVHVSETLSKALLGVPWPLLCLEDVHLALLKCPLLHEAFPNFPKQGSLLGTALAGITVVFLHSGLVLSHYVGCTSHLLL